MNFKYIFFFEYNLVVGKTYTVDGGFGGVGQGLITGIYNGRLPNNDLIFTNTTNPSGNPSYFSPGFIQNITETTLPTDLARHIGSYGGRKRTKRNRNRNRNKKNRKSKSRY